MRIIFQKDLDLLLYISVPDKFIHNRRNVLFLKTLVGNESKEDNTDISTELTDKVKIEDKEYTVDELMNLCLENLDKRVEVHD